MTEQLSAALGLDEEQSLLSVGQTLMTRCVPPKSSIDPVLRKDIKRQIYKYQLDQLNHELKLHRSLHYAATGQPKLRVGPRSHPLLRSLARKTEGLQAKLAKLEGALGHRPKRTQFAALRTEMEAFAAFTASVFKRIKNQDHQNCGPIKSWLKSADGLCQKLPKTYPAYPDIYQPYILAVNCMRVHVIQQLEPERSDQQNEPDVQMSLITNNDVIRAIERAVRVLLDDVVSEQSKSRLLTVLATLLSRVEIPFANRSILFDTVSQLYRRQALAKAEAETSTYTYKPRQSTVQEVQELEERNNLFPSWEQEWQKNHDDELGGGGEEDLGENSQEFHIPNADYFEWATSLMHGPSSNPSTFEDLLPDLSEALTFDLNDRKSINPKSAVRKSIEPNPKSIIPDDQFLAAYVLKLDTVVKTGSPARTRPSADASPSRQHDDVNMLTNVNMLTPTNVNMLTLTNVYTTPANGHCFLELWPLLSDLYRRAGEVRTEFPDQAELHAVLEMCVRLANVQMDAPLVKLAGGLERLLILTRDWDTKCAARHVSLSAQAEPLRALLYAWREVEMTSWAGLAGLARTAVRAGAWPLCFDAWDVVRGYLKGQSITGSDLTKVIVQLVESSTLGQFQLVLDFARFCVNHIAAESSDREKTLLYLQNTLLYYGMFETQVRQAVENAENVLLQEIKDLRKIIHYTQDLFSLKRAIDKAQNQLTRASRRLRESLSDPIGPFLTVNTLATATQEPIELTARPLKLPTADFLGDHGLMFDQLLRNFGAAPHNAPFVAEIGKYAGKLSKICVLDLDNVHSVFGALEALICGVQEIDGLISIPVKYEGTDEAKEKLYKTAMNQRRKPFENLLKSMRQNGISYRKGMDIDRRQLSKELLSIEIEKSILKPYLLALTARQMLISGAQNRENQAGPNLARIMVSLGEFLAKRVSAHVGAVEKVSNISTKLKTENEALKAFVGLFPKVGNQEKLNSYSLEVEKVCASVVSNCDVELSVLNSHIGQDLEEKSIFHNLHTPPPVCDSANCDKAKDCVLMRKKRFSDGFEEFFRTGYKDVDFVAQFSRKREQTTSESATFMRLIGNQMGWLSKYEKAIRSALTELRSGENFDQYKSVEKLIENIDSVVKSIVLQVQSVVKSWTALQNADVSLLAAFDRWSALLDHSKINNLIDLVQSVYQEPVEIESSGKQEIFSRPADSPERPADDPMTTRSGKILRTRKNVEKIPKNVEKNIDLEQSLKHVLNALVYMVNSYVQIVQHIADLVLEYVRGEVTLWLAIEVLFGKIVEKGFVNKIPKMEDGSGEGGKPNTMETEGTGIGEGSGSQDVSQEMTDIGQVEGLKGDEANNEQADEPMRDAEQPIEFEDDFSGDLEDLNLDDGDESEGEEPQDEPDPDTELGEVGDPDAEQQPDPELWDQPDQPEQPDLDDGGKHARQKQDQMVAGDDKDIQPSKELAGEQQEAEGESVEEDKENVNLDEELGADVEDADIDHAIRSPEQPEPEPTDAEGESSENLPEKEPENAEDASELGPEPEEPEPDVEPEPEPVEDQSSTLPEQGYEGQEEEKPDKTGQDTADVKSGGGLEQPSSPSSNPLDCSAAESQPNDANQYGDPSSECQIGARPDHLSDATQQDVASAGAHGEQKRVRKSQGPSSEPTPSAPRPGDPQPLHTPDLAPAPPGQKPQAREQPDTSQSWAHDRNDDEGESAQLAWDKTTKPKGQSEVQYEGEERSDDGQTEEMEIDPTAPVMEEESSMDRTAVRHSEKLPPNPEDAESMELDEPEPSKGHGMRESTVHTGAFEHLTQHPHDLDPLTTRLSRIEALQLPAGQASRRVWAAAQRGTQPLAVELAEILRLTLEPTVASKLEGDYRSGRRLNVRKLIPFVASGFRKNKIWLRRTKKAKRTYQVLLAIDDSYSMAHNKTRQLAIESLALLSNALRFLEVGELGLCAFGESAQLLHAFGSELGEDAGAAILSQLAFAQGQTNVAELLKFTSAYFAQQSQRLSRSTADAPQQLLLIISDGRGIFAEGVASVQRALKTAFQQNVFIVFVILDSPDSEHSVTETRVPVFENEGSKIPEIKSYMELFPFPFYVVLREIESLPSVVGNAIRQWFEIVGGQK